MRECQIEVKRYALLDTDFISKTHSVQDDGGNLLIDWVMELPGYEFFWFEKIFLQIVAHILQKVFFKHALAIAE